jgi:hypothetical protein
MQPFPTVISPHQHPAPSRGRRFIMKWALLLAAAPVALQAQDVRGRVRDAASDGPLGGATIEIVGPNVVRSARTSGDGHFVLRRVPQGRYTLMVRRLGYAPAEEQITVTATDVTIAVSLQPLAQELAAMRVRAKGAGMYGKIGGWPSLTPLRNARVQVLGATADLRTDSTGAYFTTLKPGRYLVRVTATGFGEQLFSVDIPRDSFVEASRLMDPSTDAPNPAREAAIFDASVRMRLRGPNSALVSGDELRGRDGGQFTTALKLSRGFNVKGLRFGRVACVFLNGRPMPNWPLNSLSPEDVESIELYAPLGDTSENLRSRWPAGVPCSETGEPTRARTRADVEFVVIWTRQ